MLNNITPYEKLFGKPYNISFLKVFCCLCYASTITAYRKKLNDRSVKGIFLSFPKGYIFLNLKYHSIEISKHMIFYENHFPYKLDYGLTRDPNTLSLIVSNTYNSAYDFFFSDITPPPEPSVSTSASNNASLIEPPPFALPPSTSPDLSRRSTRPRRQPAYPVDFQTANNTLSTRYPIHNYLSYNSLSSNFKTIISSINFTLNHSLTLRPPKVLLGNLSCKLSFKLLPLTIPDNLPFFHQERKLLTANEYIKSNTILMKLLNVIKFD